MIDTTNMSIMANLIQPTSTNMASNIISKKDTNQDSSLSINEMGVSSELFSSYDSNLDNLISQSELTSAIETAMSQYDGEMPTKEQFQSILSSFGFEAPNNSSSSNTLSSSQLDTISSVLENYDSDNLSQSDAQEIVAAFKEAGIEPSKELESAMEEAGFSAQEVGTLAGVGPQGGAAPQGGGGGQGAGASSSSSDEEYDAMDINQDGVVTFDEMMEYYGYLDDESDTSTNTNETSDFNQNALDNIKVLMDTLKLDSNTDLANTNSFDSILKAINNQNNNSNVNSYLQNPISSTIFDYA